MTRQQKQHLLANTKYVTIVLNWEAHSAYWTALTCPDASGHFVTLKASEQPIHAAAEPGSSQAYSTQ